MTESTCPSLGRLSVDEAHTFKVPAKLINEGSDLSTFLVSQGYQDILTFLGQLNRSMFPAKSTNEPVSSDIGSLSLSSSVQGVRALLEGLEGLIADAPPAPGPRRYGNVSFRKWFEFAEQKSRALMETHLEKQILHFNHVDDVDAVEELKTYLLGGFGSAQRLDYGTGHELSFLAFLAGIWKLGGFADAPDQKPARQIVLGIVQPYLALVRKLILTYNLEPAGTHGVWGLDDHSFAPYIFGSAQYGPAIDEQERTPTEGSIPGAPDPGDVAKSDRVQILRDSNMYFSAIGFIYDVKKGPFWEHSPTLYDISGVKAGWGKINKGMMKMYNAEVLSKFPVVQHFPFGSLFRWDRSANATPHQPDVHAQSQPQMQRNLAGATVPGPIAVTSTMQGAQAGLTRAPWASNVGALPAGPGARFPQSRSGPVAGTTPSTKAPWAQTVAKNSRFPNSASATRLPPPQENSEQGPETTPTRAPWAT